MRLRLLIPLAVATMLGAPAAAASAAFPHVVVSGESLSSVAASDGLTVEQLAAANGLSPEASLTAGSTLMIPPQDAEGSATSTGEGSASSGESTSGTGESASNTEATSSAGSYVVQPGDTLSAIAARSGMTLGELAATNGIDPNATLLSGAVIQISGTSTEAAQPTGTTGEATSAGPPYATEESVSPSEVGSIAAENGVPPSLAKAVAEQESGFNNSVVSSADARGVMQILPGTWNWIDSELAGSEHLAPSSATSNVRAGVLFLHSLLRETGGDAGLAAAGYYQGLSSVLQNGEEPETEQYVASVLALQRRFGGE